MDKKLTLSLDQKVIERAKRFAKLHKTSLSKMIESYFDSLTSAEENDNIPTTPLVKSLTGVIELPADYDFRSSRTNYLIEKHK